MWATEHETAEGLDRSVLRTISKKSTLSPITPESHPVRVAEEDKLRARQRLQDFRSDPAVAAYFKRTDKRTEPSQASKSCRDDLRLLIERANRVKDKFT